MIVLEELLEKREHIFAKHNSRGYIDFKHMFIADPEAPPLHLKITVERDGYVSHGDFRLLITTNSTRSQVFLCEPTRFFGKTPFGAAHFWVLKPEVYLTTDVKEYSNFTFQKGWCTL